MGLFTTIFGRARARDREAAVSRMQSQFASTHPSQFTASQSGTRRELLRVVLRDTLHRHGIPTAWIAGEVVATTSRTGERAMHWRLHIKHWDARLLMHSVALQKALLARLRTFDPAAGNWLSGISWEFSLEDDSACPPLPNATTWTVQARPAVIRGGVDVIQVGAPAHSVEAARADLNQLLSSRDGDFGGNPAARTWAATEPAKL